jgi:hypothetical protein
VFLPGQYSETFGLLRSRQWRRPPTRRDQDGYGYGPAQKDGFRIRTVQAPRALVTAGAPP